MANETGISLARGLRQRYSDLAALVITGYADLPPWALPAMASVLQSI
ncbi:hypothetical protein V0R50_16235 [Pseudomonas sp. 148P]|uniref:Uncharacterized protein n=1 Tax=Pseudomonas ulcerans TaxID=3115852 RepID=A0ABU7HTC6_9PSED|nr:MULTISPECIES: hypothetical protein [unclassified Pseudomonas]MEE1923345.1 hypothetical protein [Pseudomonas sp. 147P]MEE1934779.1 hypothetical protein [Pseudomonas sp. 148P]